jgi:hypothetical protein
MNVIQLNRIEIRPTDLLPIREYETKFGIKYDYLYKKSVIEGLIEPHYTPEWALSQKEVFAFLEKEKQKKLNKVRDN